MWRGIELSTRFPAKPSTIPAKQPNKANRKLSVSKYEISRARVAPSAARIAISPRRMRARAKRILVTLTHANAKTTDAKVKKSADTTASDRGGREVGAGGWKPEGIERPPVVRFRILRREALGNYIQCRFDLFFGDSWPYSGNQHQTFVLSVVQKTSVALWLSTACHP